MEKKEFRAESKRLLDLMINSIYTNKDIFLRELISNSSDAIDKIYYKALTDDSIIFNKDDYFIRIEIDEENRELKIIDTGIGMLKDELENNLGVIAKSGSHDFKKNNKLEDDYSIIGQFGVGFYSAFMVADNVKVISKAFGQDTAYKWESSGEEGYTIEEAEKEGLGTEIVLKIKRDTEDYNYSKYLDTYELQNIVRKYSNFIRYPIYMEVEESDYGEDGELTEKTVDKILNSMVPIWKKNKSELTDEDYENFYMEKAYGYDKPLSHIHMNVDGLMSYSALLYIPRTPSFDFYTKDYEKGLELYSSGVMIMEKSKELLPDYFGFVKGVVDSEDLSLNISREMLQQDRQLQLIGNRLETKIKEELEKLLKDDRDQYEEFFESFGNSLKYGIYSEYGMKKDLLQDLLMFKSSKEEKYTTLKEYKERMKEDQKYIYYGTGDSIDRIKGLPQFNFVLDKGYEVLYFTEELDEFTIKMMNEYGEVEFKSISAEDLGLEDEEVEKEIEKEIEDNKDLFEAMKEILDNKVTSVKPTKKLKEHPVYISSKGEISLEMEKLLKNMEGGEGIKAEKVLEINMDHKVFEKLIDSFAKDKLKFELYTKLLYDQALLIEGIEIENPVEFTNNIWELM